MSYRKKDFIIVTVFVLASFLFIFPFLKWKMVFFGGDLPYHINRIQELADNLRNGNWYPYLYTYHFNKTGYLLGTFYPQLTLLPFALFSILLGSYVKGIYLSFFIYTFIAMTIFYYVMRKLNRSQLESCLASIIYCFCAYRSVDAFSRFALGEFLGMVFIPLALYGLYAILIGNKNDWPCLAIGLSFTLLSHVLSTFLCICTLVIIFLLCLPCVNDVKIRMKKLLLSIIAFFCSSAIFLFPFFEQEMSNSYRQPSPTNLTSFTSPLSSFILNSLSNNISSNAVPNWWDVANIGFILIIALIWGIISYNHLDKLNRALLVLGGIFFLVSSNLFPWSIIMHTPLRIIQFPFRLLEISTIFLVPVAAKLCTVIINGTKTKWGRYLTGLLIITVIVFPWYSSIQAFIGSSLGNSENFANSKEYTNPKNKTYWWLDQYTPVMSKQHFNAIYNHKVTVGNNNYQLKKIKAIPNGLIYNDSKLRNQQNVTLPVADYTNIQVYQNGKRIQPIRKKDNLINLRTTSSGPISVLYVPSLGDKISQLVSLLTWIFLLCALVKVKCKQSITIRIENK